MPISTATRRLFMYSVISAVLWFSAAGFLLRAMYYSCDVSGFYVSMVVGGLSVAGASLFRRLHQKKEREERARLIRGE